jgi:hypothetical protein
MKTLTGAEVGWINKLLDLIEDQLEAVPEQFSEDEEDTILICNEIMGRPNDNQDD